MAKLDPRDVRIDPLLSSISVGFINKDYVASDVAPVIPSALDGGKYTVYNQADWFRDEAGKRAAGSRAKRGDYGITFDTFFCEEYAFAREIPDELRQNAMDPIRPDEDGTRYATDKVLLKKEVRVATKLTTLANWTAASGGGVTLSGTSQWSDYANSDPISNVEAAIDAIHGKTGKRPNLMVLPFPVRKALKHHPDIVDRIKYSQRGIVTVELLQELFEVERILGADAILTASNEAAAAPTYSYVWGKHVFVGYVAPNPGIQEPTAMYQFQVGARAIRRWREEPEHQDVVESFEKADEKIVSSLLGYVIRDAVA